MLGALPSRPRAAPARKQNRFAGSIQCAQYGRTEESLADPATPPDWFTRAMADAPQERMVEVDGAGVESLSWGERGRPGVLLLHGYAGHAGWWRFIAPFLAQDRRVVAMSWSGMGGSDRRGAYSFDGYAREALAVARAEGLYEAGPPVIVGHSFGSVAMLLAAARYPEALSAAVAVESTLLPLIRVRERAQAAPGERVFATVEAARARFKLSPDERRARAGAARGRGGAHLAARSPARPEDDRRECLGRDPRHHLPPDPALGRRLRDLDAGGPGLAL
jgi:pimeloyl-ACP methyl ester carboxylesterase